MVHGASGAVIITNICTSRSCMIFLANLKVGLAAVQIARANGFRVFGTAGTDEGLELVKKCGAHEVFNHKLSGYTNKIMVINIGNYYSGVRLCSLLFSESSWGWGWCRHRTGDVRKCQFGKRFDANASVRQSCCKTGLFSEIKQNWLLIILCLC